MRTGYVVLLVLLLLTYAAITYVIVTTRKSNRKQKIKHNTNSNSATEVKTVENLSSGPRVLVIQDGDYEKYPEFASYTTAINAAYCRKWGYTYTFKDHKDSNVPPYWLKVVDVQEALNTGRYDLVAYVDLDACFLDFSTPLVAVISRIDTEKGNISDMYFGEDCTELTMANTGVFLVRNTQLGRLLMQTWKSMCVNSKGERQNACSAWDKIDNKWTCKYCEWAGREYEQGTLNQLVDLFPDNVAVVDDSFFSSKKSKKKPFMIHAMSASPKRRLEIFKDIYVKLSDVFKAQGLLVNKDEFIT